MAADENGGVDQQLGRIETMLGQLLQDATRPSREWAIYADDFASDDEFRNAVRGELADIEWSGFRTGRAVLAVPIRAKGTSPRDGRENYVTIGWHFSEQFVPAARVRQPDEPRIREPEPVSEEIEPLDLESLEPTGAGVEA